jgi:hypothetical protein
VGNFTLESPLKSGSESPLKSEVMTVSDFIRDANGVTVVDVNEESTNWSGDGQVVENSYFHSSENISCKKTISRNDPLDEWCG